MSKLISINICKSNFLFMLSFFLFICLFFGLRGTASASIEDGSNYPATVLNMLNSYCSSGQPSAQTTWISVNGDPGAINISINAGDSINLMLNVVTYRCKDGVDTSLFSDRFRAKGGSYVLPNDLVRYNISELSTAPDIIVTPPNSTGPAYSRSSWSFTVHTNGATTTGDVAVTASSKQFSWRKVHPAFMCIMTNPQRLLWRDTNHPGEPPPGATEQTILQEMEFTCPTTDPVYIFRINVTPPPSKHYNLQPAEPAIDQANGTVTFNINNLGDGDARFRYDNAGTYVLYNSAYYASIWVNNKLIQPDSNFNNTFQGRPITAINPHGTWTTSYGLKKGIDYHDGDQVCALLATDPSEGETDGVITVERRESNNDTKTCIIASSQPYFRVYGGDVVVGRNFAKPGGTCNKEPNKEILAYTDNISGWVGAGTQFAASATGKIEGFMSASMRNDTTTPSVTYGVPKPPNGLSFLNTGNPSSVPIGNDDSAYRGCVPDYDAYVNSDGGWRTSPTGSVDQVSLKTLTGAKIYVYGDLNITGDIEDTSLPWSKIEDIKPIIVIVKGNINIAPNVTRLDGLYVAMPKSDGTGGVINTCEPMNTNCNSQLVINGAFVAKQVKLMRLKGDVSSATANELNTIPSSPPDPNPNIAEIFNFPTELYLGLKYQNIAPTTPNATRKDYDTIVGLPPIL